MKSLVIPSRIMYTMWVSFSFLTCFIFFSTTSFLFHLIEMHRYSVGCETMKWNRATSSMNQPVKVETNVTVVITKMKCKRILWQRKREREREKLSKRSELIAFIYFLSSPFSHLHFKQFSLESFHFVSNHHNHWRQILSFTTYKLLFSSFVFFFLSIFCYSSFVRSFAFKLSLFGNDFFRRSSFSTLVFIFCSNIIKNLLPFPIIFVFIRIYFFLELFLIPCIFLFWASGTFALAESMTATQMMNLIINFLFISFLIFVSLT